MLKVSAATATAAPKQTSHSRPAPAPATRSYHQNTIIITIIITLRRHHRDTPHRLRRAHAAFRAGGLCPAMAMAGLAAPAEIGRLLFGLEAISREIPEVTSATTAETSE
jgi:hypothetical protein